MKSKVDILANFPIDTSLKKKAHSALTSNHQPGAPVEGAQLCHLCLRLSQEEEDQLGEEGKRGEEGKEGIGNKREEGRGEAKNSSY